MSGRLIVVLALGLLSLRCSSTEPYPESWSPTKAVDKGACADISGTYSNACTPKNEYDTDCLATGGLAGLLFSRYADAFHPKLATADRVVIEQPSPSLLHVGAWHSERLVRREEILLDEDECTTNGILLRASGKPTQIEGGIGVGSSRSVLNRNAEGHLIARLDASFTGVWFIVPVSGTDHRWKRFEALEPPGDQP